MNTEPNWSIAFDKKIPIAVIIGFLVQFGGFIWYGSKLDSRVSILELQVIKNSSDISRLDIARETTALSTGHLTDQNERILDFLKELKGRSDTLHPELIPGIKR